MTESIQAVVQFAFERLELDRIQAHVLTENLASPKVLTKNGFKQEGLLRNYCFGNEVRKDTVLLSIIKEDYFEH